MINIYKHQNNEFFEISINNILSINGCWINKSNWYICYNIINEKYESIHYDEDIDLAIKQALKYFQEILNEIEIINEQQMNILIGCLITMDRYNENNK